MTLALPSVTLCCVDTRNPRLALRAVERSAAGIRFADVALFTDAARAGAAPAGVRVVDVHVPSAQAYSHFVLKALAAHVHTPHVLVVQWDGFVLRPDAWDPAFLAYDYVGPRWPWRAPEHAVGNGGFSLRSAALLRALLDPHVVPAHPEDECICLQYRAWLEEAHGLRFAPPELADRFGFERARPAGPTFGFHGVYNLPDVLGADEVREIAAELPVEAARGMDGRDFCKALIAAGQLDAARRVLRQRVALTGRDVTTRRLARRLAWARVRRLWARPAARNPFGGRGA